MIVAILNYVLLVCAAAFSVVWELMFRERVVGEDGFETLGFVGLVPPVVACVFILWRALGSPPKKLVSYWFVWSAVLALLSRALFMADSPGLEPFYVGILFITVLLPALVRAEPVWVIVYIFAALVYSGQLAVEGRVWEPQQEIALGSVGMMHYVRSMLLFAGASFLGGLIPWLILKRRDEARQAEFNQTLEELRVGAHVEPNGRQRGTNDTATKQPLTKNINPAMSTAAISANTLRLEGASSDTFSLLNVGGEGVNTQLNSMLYFMRYNFKALTAAAFIYNPAKNVLALNSYDVKMTEGVQVFDKAEIPFGTGVIGLTASDPGGGVFMTGDMALYRGKDVSYYAMGASAVNSIMAAPIIYEHGGDKELLGVLSVDSVNKNAFTEHDKELMKRFSTIAAALIVNIRMSVTLEHDAKMFRTFYEASHGFSVALKTDEILDVLMGIVPQFISACGRLMFVLYDSSKNCLRIQRIEGAKGELSEGMEFMINAGIYSFVFNRNKPVHIQDFQAQPGKYFRFAPDEPVNPSIRTLIVLPIGGEDHRCAGVFSVESSVPGLLSKETEQLLTTVTENASVAITRSLLYQKMEKLATTDGLTGLNNHRTFQEIMARELERARRYGRPLSLLLTDIDHFKSFNDTHGHPVGDMVLREVANCIRTSVRMNDYPARYGGEEFAVVLPETDEQGAVTIAERIRQAVEACIVDSGTDKLRVTISIGCVTFPTYGTTQQEIIDCSDKALYASKKGGRNRVTMFEPGMTVASK